MPSPEIATAVIIMMGISGVPSHKKRQELKGLGRGRDGILSKVRMNLYKVNYNINHTIENESLNSKSTQDINK